MQKPVPAPTALAARGARAARAAQAGLPWLALSALPLMVACGGAAEDSASAPPQAQAASTERSQSLAAAAPAVGTLLLASATASGQARSGDVCGASADGSVVLFANNSDNLVAGDNNNFASDVFAKNLRTGALTRVSASASGATLSASSATCLALTPDGRFAAFKVVLGASAAYDFPSLPSEPAIFVKNLATGALVRATPPLASLPTTADYQFAGLSSDGLRVAFVALPTSTYLGGYETRANGPARTVVSDLTNPAAVRYINLEARVRLSLSQASVYGDVLLSPDGRQLAFSTQQNYPELGDNNGKNDAFVVQVDTAGLRQVNTDVSGNIVSAAGSFGPTFGTQAFIGQGRSLVLYVNGSSIAGPSGLYAKNLDTGTFSPLLATAGLPVSGSGIRIDVSLSDAGTAAAYVRRSGNSQTGTNVATLRNLQTGAERNVATTAAGVASNGTTTTAALISADGGTVAFANNGRNLVGSNRNFELRVYAKSVAAGAAAPSR